jgi:argininosuccinate lyase
MKGNNVSENQPFTVARLGEEPSEVNQRLLYGSTLKSELRTFYEYVAVDKAHTVMLTEQGILKDEQSREILKLLDEIEAMGPDAFPVDARYGSFLFQVEKYMTDKIGEDVAGRMHTGRSRNDQSTAVDRLLARKLLLDVIEQLANLQDTILRMAREHADTLMPGYTHLQHAQPTTLGHYLMRFYFNWERDQQRLEGAYQRTNLSALGGAAMAGTSWPLNRERVAELLGHEGIVENSYDAGVFARDYPSENAAMLSILINNIARLAGDIYVFSSWEFSMVEIADGLANSSSIMPQKKNPYSVERIRGLAGLSLGWLPAVMGTLRSSHSSDIDLLFGGDPTPEMAQATLDAIELMNVTLDTLIIHEDRMRERAAIFWSTTSDLADEIVRHSDMSFRTAHHVVGRLVRNAVDAGVDPARVTTEMVDQAAEEMIGRKVGLPAEIVRNAFDGESFINTRVTPGSPNPNLVRATVDEGEQRQAAHREWLQEKQAHIDSARAELDRRVSEIVAG